MTKMLPYFIVTDTLGFLLNLFRALPTELYCFRLVRLSVVTLTQLFLIGFLPNFIYGLLPSSSRSRLNTGFV